MPYFVRCNKNAACRHWLGSSRYYVRPARCLITPRGSRLIQNSKGARLQLARPMKAIECGDVVIVTCLDRLALSTYLLRTVDAITKTGAHFHSLMRHHDGARQVTLDGIGRTE